MGPPVTTELPLSEWFEVRFDAREIHLMVKPPGQDAWQQTFPWKSITRICFKPEGMELSDGIYLFTSERPESYVVPADAKGGGELWLEILDRGLFDPTMAIDAAASTEGIFCWPEKIQ